MNVQSLKPNVRDGLNEALIASGSRDFEDLIYLLSHDVRNSVRALLEVPAWIEEDLIEAGHKITGSLAENLELVNTHTRRLDRMLIDLLVHSRVGRKQTVKSVDLAEAIDLVVEQMILPSGFTFETDLKCKSVRVGDRDILTLLSALISNAIKHHDRKEGLIRVTSFRDSTQCVLTVSDDGPGIPAKHREAVFDAMMTLRPRDEVEGSGMGLAIVRKIVDLYGGRMRWANETADRGAMLEIGLPI